MVKTELGAKDVIKAIPNGAVQNVAIQLLEMT